MPQYPNEMYTPRTVVNRPGVVYDPTKTKVQFAEDTNNPNAEIVAIEMVLGLNPAGAYASVKAWLSALTSAIGSIVVPTKATGAEINTGTDDAKFATSKAIKDSDIAFLSDVSAVLQVVYPVGAIFIATVSTNPATLFGFGTWTAYGAGRVLVGKASSGTFAIAGATGGEERHTLSESEMPSHKHRLNEIGQFLPGSPYNTVPVGIGGQIQETGCVENTGGSQSHNNLQPYIVSYIWTRTA